MVDQTALVPIDQWRAALTAELRRTTAVLAGADLQFDLLRLPSIPIQPALLDRLTDGHPDDSVAVLGSLIDSFSRIFASFVARAGQLAAHPALERFTFRLDGAIQALVLARRMSAARSGSGGLRYTVQLVLLESVGGQTAPVRLTIAERREPYSVLTLMYSDTAGTRAGLRHTAVALLLEALHRQYNDLDVSGADTLRWGESLQLETLRRLLGLVRGVDDQFDRALAPLVRATFRDASRTNSFVQEAFGAATALVEGLSNARVPSDTSTAFERLRDTIDAMANRGGMPRNLPQGMTRTEAFSLVVQIAIAMVNGNRQTADILLRASYGPDDVDYDTLDYTSDEESDTDSISAGARAFWRDECCADGSVVTHI